jgi:hypothetical protein
MTERLVKERRRPKDALMTLLALVWGPMVSRCSGYHLTRDEEADA